MIAREQDAIFALASGAGGAAIAEFRINEPGCAASVKALVAGSEFPTRRAIVRNLLRPVSLEPIDRALIARSEAIRSFAGEDSVELKTYGWPGCCCPSSWPTLPEEFVWRAFINGKIDPSQDEGLADEVSAETGAQQR